MALSRLDGYVAVVTGAGHGIGRAIASRFVDEGARVVIFDADRTAAQDAADKLGERARVHVGNTTNESDIESAMQTAVDVGGRLDVLVNCAAGEDPNNGSVDMLDHLTGPLLCAKHAIPHLRRQRGTILNISARANGSLETITDALASSLGPAIRVYAIAQVGRREDIVALAAYLASCRTAFGTGEVFKFTADRHEPAPVQPPARRDACG